MKLIQSNKLGNYIESIIHHDTQQHNDHFDLTFANIQKVTDAGSLDFGGSEFKPAEKRTVEVQKNEGEDYGWWHLPKGTYQATMNETVKDLQDTVAILAPHPHTQKAGLIANTCIISSEEEAKPVTMNFRVPEVGCNIKENARIAVVYLLTSQF